MSSITENESMDWPVKFEEASQEINKLRSGGVPHEMVSLLSSELKSLELMYEKIVTSDDMDADSTLQTEWPKFARKLSDDIVQEETQK